VSDKDISFFLIQARRSGSGADINGHGGRSSTMDTLSLWLFTRTTDRTTGIKSANIQHMVVHSAETWFLAFGVG